MSIAKVMMARRPCSGLPQMGIVEIVRLLVENGADANTRYSDGGSVLLWAADQKGI